MDGGGGGEVKQKATNMKDKVKKEAVEGDDDKLVKKGGSGGGGSGKKGTNSAGGGGSGGGGGGGGGGRNCQAERCTVDLSDAKQYHRRHKVCEHHAKAQVVMVAGNRQRFCQQCSRFHELSEFDEAKRSCRRRLAGHNERRRKSTVADSHGEGSAVSRKGGGQVDERGRTTTQISIQENNANTYKHIQIR